MEHLTIGCVDVYYYEQSAKACCIIFDSNSCATIAEYAVILEDVDEYISGQFYKRELPCIVKVLENVKERIDLLIIDGFVWLGDNKKGLGVHLYETLEEKIPVIGVAKTYFKDCTNCLEVYRCNSKNPLYISAIGIDLAWSAQFIKNLEGEYRIPNMLKRVDKLSRELKGRKDNDY